MHYTSLRGKPFDMDGALSAAQKGQKIYLIKELRNLSGMGLREAKDAVEDCQVGPVGAKGGRGYDYTELENMFAKYCEPIQAMEKPEFMNILEGAIDNMGSLHFTNMLDAVETLCKNIRSNGGLEAITKKNAEFLNGI